MTRPLITNVKKVLIKTKAKNMSVDFYFNFQRLTQGHKSHKVIIVKNPDENSTFPEVFIDYDVKKIDKSANESQSITPVSSS